jgi:aryl-alcohol dehydrogenase-like predicted oxidoreductase
VQLATKFMPLPWKLNVRRSLVDSLKASLDRLGLEQVDLYQIHGPISLRGTRRWPRRSLPPTRRAW